MKWMLFSPEIYYFVSFVIFLCLSLVKRANPKRDYFTALFLSALGVIVCLAAVRMQGGEQRGNGFRGVGAVYWAMDSDGAQCWHN